MLSHTVRNLARTSRRSFATNNSNIYATAINTQQNLTQKMLADPATYPLIFILGVACAGCSGFGLYFLKSATDVRIDPTKRSRLIRNWSKGE